MSGLQIGRADARVTALTEVIDYAGLFPPESLDMEGAVAGYRAARGGEHAWMVGRFICPASRLQELAGVLVPSMTEPEAPWRLTVVGDAAAAEWLDAVEADLVGVAAFDEEMTGAAAVETFEKVIVVDDRIEQRAVEASRRVARMCYFEVPWHTSDLEGALESLAAAREVSGRRLGAKIRCGGPTVEHIPPPESVARFLAGCARLSLPVKATAGLHHPVRGVDPGSGLVHHGFVNVLVAAGLAREGADVETLIAVLSDTDAAGFGLDRSGARWRDATVGGSALAATRSELFVGFGSCSVDEPVDDLTALGVLPVTA